MVTPNSGVFHAIKVNLVALLPYIMMFIIIYLIITINVLKSALKKLNNDISDETIIKASKIMNISFDVKRMMGVENLQALYNNINFAKNVSLHAKTLFYNSLRRKKIEVPLPSGTN